MDNVHEYLQASDLFVFPSEREAFGISIIEAMACRLPVVTTAVDGISDVVRPDVDALVVPRPIGWNWPLTAGALPRNPFRASSAP